MHGEIEHFLDLWDRENVRTEAILSVLPNDRYDFRPDPDGRSLGELAWHLGELEAYGSTGIANRQFKFDVKPVRSERPLAIAEILPAFKLTHADARDRIAALSTDDLDADVWYPHGGPWTVRRLLWERILLHSIHHRGQLGFMCRLAGVAPPAFYGRTREATLEARRAATVAR